MTIVVAVAFLQKFIDEMRIFRKLSFVGFENDCQFLSADTAVMIKVKISKGKSEVVSIVGCCFWKAGGDKLIIGESSVVVYVHMLHNLSQISKLLSLLSGHIGGKFLYREIPVFILINFKKNFSQGSYILLRELWCDIVQYNNFELCYVMITFENLE